MSNPPIEFLIHHIPNENLFNKYVDRIISEFNGHLIERLENLDLIYCDFNINSELITLHQDIYLGISIFPKMEAESNPQAIAMALQIGFQLKYPTDDQQTWVIFPNGREDEINYLVGIIIDLRKEQANFTQISASPLNSGHPLSCRICGSALSMKFWEAPSASVCNSCYNDYMDSSDFIEKIESLTRLVKVPD